MTDQPNNAPQFSDDQMDQLLSTFYRMEMPAELDQLPSSWPAVTGESAAKARQQESVSLAQPESQPAHRATSAGRGLAVAGATLAACLMVIVLSTTGGNLDNTETAGTKDNTPVVGDTDTMMDVHKGNSGSGVVDDVNTTLDEIDGVDLAPEQKPEEESKDSSEQK
ncbi:MAG TPA: hypothetical protein EYG03_24880 [Planctomycetes bacterium]|nr:hypothetical protein [Fuerstiella sp.]HIK95190.1 hypothetical protein [Planctomycetota bacterium]